MELAIIEKKLAMDSRDIARLTHKKHYVVMRDIRNMLEKIDTELYTSFEKVYCDKYGREQKCFLLPYRELLVLLTGYSVELRIAVVDRWIQLEKHYQTERKKSIEVRNTFTDELKDRGYEKQFEYIQTTTQMKKPLEISHKKSEMTAKELKAIRASEAMASLLLENEYGYKEVNPVCVKASNIVSSAMQKRISQ